MAHNPDRESFFPKIEKKHGQPMKYWFQVMKDLEGMKYPEQIAFLKEEHGFSQAHANALVMYSRGSKSSKRFDTMAGFLKDEDPIKQRTIKKIFKVIQEKYPKSELVIAWNKPMIKFNDKYVFGVATAKNHILIAPFDADTIDQLRPKLKDYKVNKKTIEVPSDWKVDEKLLLAIVKKSIENVK
ncbi:MAG: DUF4287 domain-containing protein [Candidatus Nanopelagicaceae bacterium]